MAKRRLLIGFDHDDTGEVNGFFRLRNIIDGFELYNHKLDRRINSTDKNRVQRVIREEYICLASVTVVLIGSNTAASHWVRWEAGPPAVGRHRQATVRLDSNHLSASDETSCRRLRVQVRPSELPPSKSPLLLAYV